MSGVQLNAERFFTRLGRLEKSIQESKSTTWGDIDGLCICAGLSSDDHLYTKSSSLHLYLLGYEFSDTVLLLTKGTLYFMASEKKCGIWRDQILPHAENYQTKIELLEKTKDDGMNREHMNRLLNAVRGKDNKGKKIGSLFKLQYDGKFISTWMDMVKGSQLEMFEAAPAIGKLLSIKDENELVS
jgi:nucleosome binding factor SPN SPT16 subunit